MKRLAIMLLALAGFATACQGNVFSLEVGQCFDDPDSFGEISDVEIVDCSAAHDNEVFHLFDIPGDDFPGSDTVSNLAGEGCSNAFAGYVGTAYQDSDLFLQFLVPSEGSWDQDDREVVCYLYEPGVRLTGSARNSNR